MLERKRWRERGRRRRDFVVDGGGGGGGEGHRSRVMEMGEKFGYLFAVVLQHSSYIKVVI